MLLCNAEIIKKIKELDERKQQVLLEERDNCMTTYQTETDKIDTGYDFAVTRTQIKEIDSEIMRLKHLLNTANATVKVEEFDLTIGECLVHMAQLNNEKLILERMARATAKTRRTVYNGAVEYTVTNYDIGVCKQYLEEIKAKVMKLQLAVDRINLSNMIEV